MNADFIMSWSRKSKDKLNNAKMSRYEKQIWTSMVLPSRVRWIPTKVH